MFDSTKIILAAAAVVALAFTFVFGQTVGESAQKKRNEQVLAEKLSALSGERDQLVSETRTIKQEHTEAKATVVALRDKLKSQVATKQVDQAELRLYRRIANMDDAQQRGLHVDKVTMSKNFETNEVSLNVLLVQSQGRTRVKGSIGANLIPDTGKAVALADASQSSAPDFNLRFFQTVHIPVPDVDNTIDEIEIVVKPAGKQHKPFVERIPWSEIERLR